MESRREEPDIALLASAERCPRMTMIVKRKSRRGSNELSSWARESTLARSSDGVPGQWRWQVAKSGLKEGSEV